MRLIDADALLENQPKGCYRTSDWISDAPTIDAIPVEWLKQWRDKLKGMGEYQRECAEDISFVLGLWQREQETQDDRG